jgi:Tfp pilus assembly protein PilV
MLCTSMRHLRQSEGFSVTSARSARSARLPRRTLRGDAGFTILEVALAGFVMAFGIATSIIALQMGFRALDVARDSTVASQIMQSEIERLRLLPWSNTSTATGVSNLPSSASVSLASMFTANPQLVAKFTVTRTVEPDSARPADVRYITISVQWRSYDGRPHTRSFTTMYSKNGLYDYYYTLANAATPAT